MPQLVLVNDDPNVLEGFTRILQHAGYEVFPFASFLDARGALIQLDAPQVDAFILDLSPSEMTSDELYQTLPTLYHQIPIIYIHGVSDTQKGRFNPNITYLSKPFSYQELIDTIEETVTKKVHVS